ncbi:MAG: ROK family transcriptional regulator [Clostridia bacterium]|nr:ROK family transcriptional regulator [Clostridia bacterium]
MAKLKGLNNNHLKTNNRGMVLRTIAGGRHSRTDIAQNMGLTKMAISKIVGELFDDGYLVEKEADPTAAVGRTPVLLGISDSAPLAIGVYVARSEIRALICDLRLRTLFEEKTELRGETKDTLMQKIFALTDAAFAYLQKNRPENRLLGVGVSSISPLDPLKGRILAPTNFYGISDLDVVKEIGDRYGCPVYLDNDMNASALAESIYGIGKKYDSFLYLGITNGIGSGAILDGRPFSDHSITVGEIGHMCINFDGPLCFCGNRGCLELYSDINVILDRLRRETGESTLTPHDLERVSKKPGCALILRDMIDKLSVALINAVNLLDTQCVVVGHEGAFLPDEYLKMLENKINRGILAAQYKTVEVVRSTFLDAAPQLGGACLVLDRFFSGAN